MPSAPELLYAGGQIRLPEIDRNFIAKHRRAADRQRRTGGKVAVNLKGINKCRN